MGGRTGPQKDYISRGRYEKKDSGLDTGRRAADGAPQRELKLEGRMEFRELIERRYSCKKFGSRMPDDEKLNAILEAGRAAPTAKNLQEQHIYVVRSGEGLLKIDSFTKCRYGAPVVLVVAFDSTNVYTYPGGRRDSGIEDAAIVATHMILAAADQGVDSCWLNNFDPDGLAAALGLPAGEKILMLMDLGYAAENAAPLPNHFSRKPLGETVTFI